MNPLEDPGYLPEHPPVNGQIPDLVRKWGKATQLRWFRRFGGQLSNVNWDHYKDVWVDSENHTGRCCPSCLGEYEDGYQGGGMMADGFCCCHDKRARVLYSKEP